MTIAHWANVVVHVAFGAAALLIGLLPMLTAKGSAAHRRWGLLYVQLGAVVLATALIGVVFFDPPAPLIAATLAASYQYAGGLRALRLRHSGPRVADALIAVAGLALCAALYAFMGPGTASWTPAIGYSTIGYVAFLSVYDLTRYAWAGAWRAGFWRYDHGLKLTGAYFAMASAGIGNVLRDLQPWSQVLPSLVGVVVMVALAVAFATRDTRRRTHAA